eukprot:sb/3478213/
MTYVMNETLFCCENWDLYYIFSLPGWMPKASTRMPFCFAKRHSRVRIRKRHFGILNSVEEHFMSHYCQGQRFSLRTQGMTCSFIKHVNSTFSWICVARNVAV